MIGEVTDFPDGLNVNSERKKGVKNHSGGGTELRVRYLNWGRLLEKRAGDGKNKAIVSVVAPLIVFPRLVL